MSKLCPCGSKKTYSNCCEPFHLGQATAQTAEALMRSRYSAYVLENETYLLKTWAKTTRPGQIPFEKGLVWTKLRVIKTQKGQATDTEGKVWFKAYYQQADQKGVMSEKSFFIRDEQSQWVYVNGEVR
ncbi:hypothetical protein CYQ88_06600 [Hydrogenovibrio sp. SC-1]|uniref:YchJ family protein n=1 Tax=Hydrogenovibrio sp. SC-1 TaxID=2065820 RepID=UPI000C7BD0B0|nr:YchJ family metal-binding protein [Hydrogenovibrio sp. SC-1]PLA74354.1 hypothetical protein CYQ88_06600 [Hydrogenovibrio sp. SC-1]